MTEVNSLSPVANGTKKRLPLLKGDQRSCSSKYDSLIDVLSSSGNLLVWGVDDGDLSRHVTNGTITFLQDDSLEIYRTASTGGTTNLQSNLQIYRIRYCTNNTDGATDNRWRFPENVKSTVWDAILVDIPSGCFAEKTSTIKSIDLSVQLATDQLQKHLSKRVHIFVNISNQPRDKENHLSFSDSWKTLRMQPMDANFSDPCHPLHFVLKQNEFSLPNGTSRPFQVTTTEGTDWTVLVIVVDQFYEYFLNWLAHYKKLILNHLDVIVVAGDESSMKKLLVEPRLPAHFQVDATSVITEGVGSIPSSYGRSIETAQVHSISKRLQSGQNIIYTDVRTVWLSDPIPLIESLQDSDIIAGADGTTPQVESPRYTARFLVIRTNERSKSFMKEWKAALQSSKWNEATFNSLMNRGLIHAKPFPPYEFQNGSDFCSPQPEHPPEKAVIVHSIDKSPHLKQNLRFHNKTLWLLGQNESVSCEPGCNGALLTMTATLFMAEKGTQKFGIQLNTLKAITQLRPEVDIVVFSTGQDVHDVCKSLGIRVVEDFGTNPYGTPFLHSLFQRLETDFSQMSTFIGYMNADIIFDSNLVLTLRAIKEARDRMELKRRILLVGRRINVEMASSFSDDHPDSFNNSTDIDSYVSRLKSRGRLFGTNAEDFFIVTPGTFVWKEVPEFVIGRPGYDNWLVDYVYHKANSSDLIDVTTTVPAIHQTGKDGNGAGHKKKKPDRSWNRDRAKKKQYDHGRTSFARWTTAWGKHKSSVILRKRK